MQPSPSSSSSSHHSHDFGLGNPLAVRRTAQVMVLTAVMMIVEIVAGTLYGSMALLADGWHMSSHALALGVSAGAYALARRHMHDPRFAFGTWKIEILGGYTSAVLLLGVAAYMGIESLLRLVEPTPIRFDQAIPVAIVGLLVNLVSAWALATGHEGGHGHPQGHHHGHDPAHDPHVRPAPMDAGEAAHHHDLNLRSAYLHVVADAVTSVLAIVALVGGRYFGAVWLDPVMGLVGTVLVARWAIGLLRDSGRVLLDAEMDAPVVAEIREVIDTLPASTTLRDLHVWRVGQGRYACIIALQSAAELDPDHVRAALAIHPELAHVTVEVTRARRD